MPLAIAALLILSVTSGVLIFHLSRRLEAQRLELEESQRAQLMYQAAVRMAGTLDAREIYAGLRDLTVQAIPFDGMIVSSYEADSRRARCAYLWVNGQVLDHSALPVLPIDLENGTGMQTEVIRSGRGKLYADVHDRVRRGGRYFDVSPDGGVRDLSKPDAPPPGARCALMVPFKLEGKVVGIVQVMSDTRGLYTAEHLNILESLVAPMAVALENAELYARAYREIAERMRVERALTESEGLLREADRRKDEFLATLAHELRNPLAPIRTAVALLRGEDEGHEHLPRALGVIERQVGHMARLLDDLLDVGRISTGTLPLRMERVELAEVVDHGVEASRPLIDAGRHELAVTLYGEPVAFTADGTRLAQVLSNLLNNAARYSDDGSRIELNAGREGDEVVIRVRDRGVGIAPELLPRIFDPFLQIDHVRERSRGGLGIGLSLVKKLVELHGGHVEAASAGPGQGSEFTVRLPLRIEPLPGSPPPRTPKASAPKGAKRRILVVDDLPDSADSLALLLQRHGHEARTAYDGAEAVEIAREFKPDVVLLDLGLPVLSGYEAARQIRALSGDEPALLIAITGWGHDQNRQRAREAGFDHHLVKPVDPAALMRLLASEEQPDTA